MTTDELIGVAIAADILCVSLSTAKRMAKDGDLAELATAKMPGRTGAYVFHRSDVERLAAERAGGAA